VDRLRTGGAEVPGACTPGRGGTRCGGFANGSACIARMSWERWPRKPSLGARANRRWLHACRLSRATPPHPHVAPPRAPPYVDFSANDCDRASVSVRASAGARASASVCASAGASALCPRQCRCKRKCKCPCKCKCSRRCPCKCKCKCPRKCQCPCKRKCKCKCPRRCPRKCTVQAPVPAPRLSEA